MYNDKLQVPIEDGINQTGKIHTSFICLFVCLFCSEAVNSSGILSIQMFPKELTEWGLRIALIYTFMRVTLMQITLVLPPMRITFVRSAAQKARLFRFQTHSHLYCTESQIQTY